VISIPGCTCCLIPGHFDAACGPDERRSGSNELMMDADDHAVAGGDRPSSLAAWSLRGAGLGRWDFSDLDHREFTSVSPDKRGERSWDRILGEGMLIGGAFMAVGSCIVRR